MKKSNKKENLDLSHQLLLKERFLKLNANISDFSFANLYLFRHLHHYEVIIDEEIYIQGKARDGTPFLMLTSFPPSNALSNILALSGSDKILFPVLENWLPFFENFPFIITYKNEESDYLFKKDKLAFFPGRHLSKKRNLVKQFFSLHRVETKLLKEEQYQEGLKVLNDWQNGHTLKPEETDYFPCKEALENLSILALEAKIVYVDGIPSGLLIGERLNQNCYVIHFTKGNKSIKGLYQFLYQDCAQSLAANFEWINLEQDLGSPDLHQAKHSYLPDKMVNKFRLAIPT
ncbi:MAG: DUF2156 domain-containing protein [Candidatus Protochlamydia sp.]|nr:DUF2156 domain-containing protein [Candidatus Protochlamydia sp.]